jgi:hypothetical protein
MAASSEEELTALKFDWKSRGMTWERYGNGTQKDVDDLKIAWFPSDIENRFALQDIWARHPTQQLLSGNATNPSRFILSTSMNAHAFACPVKIENFIDNSKALNMKLHVDSLFTGELLLLQTTVDALGLKIIPNSKAQIELGDKSIANVVTYEDVIVTLTFSNNSVQSAKVTPIVLQMATPTTSMPCKNSNSVVELQKVKGEDADELLGHAACEKLFVKYDFANHTLSKIMLRM